MGLKDIKNQIGDVFLGIRARGLLSKGLQFVNYTIEQGAVEPRAIELFTGDRMVQEAFGLWSQSAATAGRLASGFLEGTDDAVIDKFVDENPEMIEAQTRFEEASRRLSIAQLGALLQLQGEKIEQDLKKYNL